MSTGRTIGRAFSYFREGIARAAGVKRSEFIHALSKRNDVEWISAGVKVGNLALSDIEIDEIIASREWDGSVADADEMVGDWLEKVVGHE